MPVLLMTRPQADSDRFLAQLGAPKDVQVVVSPLLQIRVAGVVGFHRPAGVIFTSANAVYAAGLLGIPPGVAFCVGNRTTNRAREAGWLATRAGDSADQLVATLTQHRPETPLVHLRGRHARGAIAQRLSAEGLATSDAILYEQEALPLTKAAQDVLKGNLPVIIPLFSPRTARQFAESQVGTAPRYFATISEAVAEPVKPLKHKEILVSDTPDASAMARCVAKLIKDASRVEGVGGAQ